MDRREAIVAALGSLVTAIALPDSVSAQSVSCGRERLTADRTYYVSPSGNDANDGLLVTTPFATIQKALDVSHDQLDLAGFNVVIQLADGTYPEALLINKRQVGTGRITVRGNVSAPQNVIVDSPDAAFRLVEPTTLGVEAFEIRAVGRGLWVNRGQGKFYVGNGMRFGQCGTAHMQAHTGVIEIVNADYSIVGNCERHFWGEAMGHVFSISSNVTLVGTRNFAKGFVVADQGSSLRISSSSVTYSGSATGKRYEVTSNGVIHTGGGGGNFFPGNSAGTTASGGIYV